MGQPVINFILGVFMLTMVMNLLGCGMVTAPIKGASVEANEEVSIQEPLQTSKSRARAIKTIAVAIATAPKGDDDKRTQF